MKKKYIYGLSALSVIMCLALCACEPNVDTGENTEIIVTGGNNDITQESSTESSSQSVSDTGELEEMLNRANVNPSELSTIDNTLIGWGLGKNYDEYKRPLDAVKAQEKYGKYDAVFIGDNSNELTLTFDCGYENGFTGEILDTLKEKGTKAFFFVTYDYCKRNGDLVERMILEGHTVGNHSTSHPSFPSLSVDEMIEEITVLHDYVENEFGYCMKYLRFPMGEYSERCLALAQQLGYKSMFWSFAHLDWDINAQPMAEEAYERIVSSLHNGEILLLHTVSRANAECLGDVIDFWNNSGVKTVL